MPQRRAIHPQQQQTAWLTDQQQQLRHNLRDAARRLQHYKGEMQVARASQQASLVTQNLSRHRLKANLGDVAQSLERIRARHLRVVDIEAAMEELAQEDGDEGLEQCLQLAGISTPGQTPQQVLERLRGKLAPG